LKQTKQVAQSPLQTRLLEQLRLHLGEGMHAGDRLNEAELAERLGVSRTPLRHVLLKLKDDGILDLVPRRGFVLKDISLFSKVSPPAGDFLDDRVMQDMALGELKGVFSERALMLRYGVPQGTLTSTLRRLTRDQLVEPSSGRGWVFADVSTEALADSYRFRQIMEPAGLLSDDYQVDEEALRALDGEHADACERVEELDRRWLFELDARFHRAIAEGANSAEFVNAVERQNSIRRVAEYIGFVRLDRVQQSLMEHRGVINALLSGSRQLAASLMQVHLKISRDETFAHMDDDLRLLRQGRTGGGERKITNSKR